MSFVFLKVLFNRNMGNCEKELRKIYVVSMPSAVININILGKTFLSKEKSAPRSYNASGLKATGEL